MTAVTLLEAVPGKDLAAQAEALAEQERVLLAQLAQCKSDLETVVLQRCAVADAQRKQAQASPAKAKSTAVNWKKLLTLKYQKRKTVKQARELAFAELHLERGWISWRDRTQILVAFELSKNDPNKLYWVKDGLTEILPHIEPFAARPGYKLLGISHNGPFNMRYFLLCDIDNASFIIEDATPPDGVRVKFEGTSLQAALEYVQRHIAR